MDPLKEKQNFESYSGEKVVTIQLDHLRSIEKEEIISLNQIEKDEAEHMNEIEQEAILDWPKKNNGNQEENKKRKFTVLSDPGMYQKGRSKHQDHKS